MVDGAERAEPAGFGVVDAVGEVGQPGQLFPAGGTFRPADQKEEIQQGVGVPGVRLVQEWAGQQHLDVGRFAAGVIDGDGLAGQAV